MNNPDGDAVRPHSRYRKDFIRRLNKYKRRIRRRYIPRPSLHLPSMSAWRVLYLARQDQALITLTGIDFATFDYLAPKFEGWYNRYTPWTDLVEGKIMPVEEKRGRKRLLHAMDCMALALAWTRTRGSTMILSMVFGMTSTPLSLYIRFGRGILSAVLSREAKLQSEFQPTKLSVPRHFLPGYDRPCRYPLCCSPPYCFARPCLWRR